MTFVIGIYVAFTVGIALLVAIAIGIAVYLKRKEEKDQDGEKGETKDTEKKQKPTSKSSDPNEKASKVKVAAMPAFKKGDKGVGEGIGGNKSGLKTSGMGMTDVAW